MIRCIFEGNASGHHVTNVVLHIVATLMLFGLLFQMTGWLGRSAVVAALFGLHPLRVESVASIAERKDVPLRSRMEYLQRGGTVKPPNP